MQERLLEADSGPNYALPLQKSLRIATESFVLDEWKKRKVLEFCVFCCIFAVVCKVAAG